MRRRHFYGGNFERICKESSGLIDQIALGGRGDPDQHENFEEILKNYDDITDEIFYNYVSDKSSNEEHIFTYDGVTESLRSNYYLE